MGSTRSRQIAFAASLFGAFVPLASSAQFDQYTQTGGPDPVVVDPREALEEAVEEARWRFGGLRVDPWIGIRNVGYVDSGDAGDQLSGSGGLGFRAYLPNGPKVIWAAHVLPEYTWLEDSSARSRVNGRYGVGLFGFFNRLTVEALATRQEALDIVSTEIQQRVNARSEGLRLLAELRLAGSINLYVSGSSTTIENLLEDEERLDPGIAPFDLLDRDEEVLRGGFRYRSRGDWLIGLGVEDSTVDFDDSSFDRSNSGTSPFVELAIPGRRIAIDVDLVLRELEPDGLSEFVPFDDVTGSLSLVIGGERSRLSPALYARRELVYTLGAASYLLDERFGVRGGLPIGRRFAVRAFLETGTNDYTGVTGPERNDDVAAYGGDLAIQVASRLALSIGYSTEEFESNLPGLDRTIDVLRAGVTFGASRGLWY
ncbi:MAG TPA: hypothetical protein VMT85_01205 [Thermoanaerobaculia bacterium]|nr:hypothetical protein [Thermoanaerobaculia bacterium]